MFITFFYQLIYFPEDKSHFIISVCHLKKKNGDNLSIFLEWMSGVLNEVCVDSTNINPVFSCLVKWDHLPRRNAMIKGLFTNFIKVSGNCPKHLLLIKFCRPKNGYALNAAKVLKKTTLQEKYICTIKWLSFEISCRTRNPRFIFSEPANMLNLISKTGFLFSLNFSQVTHTETKNRISTIRF